MIDCDCADALAWREQQERIAEREKLERQRIREARAAKCVSCGGDGYVSRYQDGATTYGKCHCDYGTAWNIAKADDVAIVPVRFVGARLEQFPLETREQCSDLNTLEGFGLLIHGGVGTGKTHLAAAVLYDLLREYDWNGVMFSTMPDLLDRIRATYNGGERDDVLERALSARLLVLDDLGTEKISSWVIEKVYQIVNHRYNYKLPIVCTTNLPPSRLASHIGERTVSRLLEICRVVKLEGADRRVDRGAALGCATIESGTGRSMQTMGPTPMPGLVRVDGGLVEMLRKTLGLTTRELARRAGVCAGTARRAEHGGAMTSEALERLCAALGVGVGEVVTC